MRGARVELPKDNCRRELALPAGGRMDVQHIRQEFNIRYYLWAQLEAEREITNSFPNLQSFRCGTTWKMYQYMRQLEPNGQNLYARALLKHYHSDASKALGEKITENEANLLSRGWSCSPPNRRREQEVRTRQEAGERIKFASKRLLRVSMTAKFRQAFGEQCLGLDQSEAAQDLRFQMKFNEWMVQTSFWFGRQHTLMSYKHLIAAIGEFHIRFIPKSRLQPSS